MRAYRGLAVSEEHQELAAAARAVAGGTSEISRTQIAERVLGLPRG